MSADNAYFEKRLKRIARTHGRLERRATRKVVRNGLIEVRPRIFVPKLPIKGGLMMLVAGFAFKAYVYADLGRAGYAERVELLANASRVQKVGAWILQADLATVLVGNFFNQMGV